MKSFVSLSKKLTLFVVGISLTISVATVIFSYYAYRMATDERFVGMGSNIARTVADFIGADASVNAYINGETEEEAYEQVLSQLRIFQRDNELEYIFLMQPLENGIRYLYDTDQSAEGYSAGSVRSWTDELLPYKQRLLNGQRIDASIFSGEKGNMLTLLEPVYEGNGRLMAYVGVEISTDRLVSDRLDFLGAIILIMLAITVLSSYLSMHIVRWLVIVPINTMMDAVKNSNIGQIGEDGEFTPHMSGFDAIDVHTNDELEMLADAMQSMASQLNEHFENFRVVSKKADTDDLTGLHNRAAFQKHVEEALYNKRKVKGQIHAFIMVDVDNFKQVNDTYGHHIGDMVLKECAEVLANLFRTEDMLARMGGDEFAVFCVNVGSPETVRRKAEGICSTLRAISVPDGACIISASVGITIVPCDCAVNYQGLYEQADNALYASKNGGRNRYEFYAEPFDLKKPPKESTFLQRLS